MMQSEMKPVVRAKRLSHATFETPDLQRLVDFQVNILGLSIAEREPDRVVLKGCMGQPAVVLQRGASARCTALAFQIAPHSDLNDLRKRLSETGLKSVSSRDLIPGIGEIVSFQDPKGTMINIFAEAQFLDEDRSPKAFQPLKLGHLAFKVQDVAGMAKFYGEVLGLRVSDWRRDLFVWMRCGPDHHTANFVLGDTPKMHHIAFELADRAEILRACDFLGRNGWKIIWGPGRHVIGDNVFVYFRDPDGHIVELYAEMARIDSEDLGYFAPRPWRDDRPYTPAVWAQDTISNLWGAGPPPGFGD